MTSTQELPGHPQQPINGHELSPDLLQGSTGQDGPDREATRYLSAATQLSIDYARLVVARVMHEPFRALAPSFGADVTVVTKWALKALRTRAVRDYILAATCAAALALLVLSLFWLPALALLFTTLIPAWLTVSWERWERFHRTVTHKMLWDRFEPAAAPDPPSADEQRRLEAVAERKDGNLVVFSKHSAFIGSGERLSHRRLVLDISRGTENDDGTQMDPIPFNSQQLHAAITDAFDTENGLAKRLSNIRVYQRLFVNGLHIRNDAQLLPNPLRPPPTSVNHDLLTAATLHPTPEARAYVCVEMPGWQGQLVVTLFIRSVHTGKSLYLDWTFQVLPPLDDQFLAIDRTFEQPLFGQLCESLLYGLRKTLPALILSPLEARRAWRAPEVARRKRARQAYAIENGYAFDYGAQRSIREGACGWQRRHHFLARDETMYMLLAQRTLTTAVVDFLTERNIDIGQFKEQLKLIDNSVNIGNVSGTGITIGDNSSSTVNSSGKEEA